MSGRKFCFRDSLLVGSVYYSAYKHTCSLVILTSISRKQSVGVYGNLEGASFKERLKAA